jgi:BtpA family
MRVGARHRHPRRPSGVIESLFGVPRALVGVVHTRGLPGTPSSNQHVDEIVEAAVVEARVYAAAGFHGLIIENTHDRPYLKGSVGPEIAAALAVIGHEVRRAARLPLGVQVLAGANESSRLHRRGCPHRRIVGETGWHLVRRDRRIAGRRARPRIQQDVARHAPHYSLCPPKRDR